MKSFFTGTPTYLASKELQDAVNVAIALERPLLIKGEPGTGKTRLAEAIAESLDTQLLNWNIKSTTKAQDGLYVYDTVARLNDSRFADKDISDIAAYIRFGALGQSFQKNQRVVLLIDEIDKADMEFPNDLLHELDRMRFFVDETQKEIEAVHRPVVLITSNNEKELPDAFLRRCVFHYIEFPKDEQMREIINVHHPRLDETLLDEVLKRFYWLRSLPEIRKRPSTSEVVDWISALLRAGLDPSVLETELPFLGVLLKREQDIDVARNPPSRRRFGN